MFWSVTANGCVPDETAIKFDRHRVNVASVQHAPGNLDLITLNCPVTARFVSMITNWGILLTYRDSTGTGTSAFIRVRFYRMPIGTTIPILLTEGNSNDLPATGNTSAEAAFEHAFDFQSNSYWVRIDMDRSTTDEIVVLHSVTLQDAI